MTSCCTVRNCIPCQSCVVFTPSSAALLHRMPPRDPHPHCHQAQGPPANREEDHVLPLLRPTSHAGTIDGSFCSVQEAGSSTNVSSFVNLTASIKSCQTLCPPQVRRLMMAHRHLPLQCPAARPALGLPETGGPVDTPKRDKAYLDSPSGRVNERKLKCSAQCTANLESNNGSQLTAVHPHTASLQRKCAALASCSASLDE